MKHFFLLIYYSIKSYLLRCGIISKENRYIYEIVLFINKNICTKIYISFDNIYIKYISL